MTDLTQTIAPKSDQLNADDLIVGPRTIKITNVSLLAGEQPIAIRFDGDDGKPYKPCKSMRRVLVTIWGSDGTKYVGRSMTLYRDEKVVFGGQEVGGIRISHMSHIDKPVTMALTASKAKRKPYTVAPLVFKKIEESKSDLMLEAQAAAEHGTDVLKAFWDRISKPQKMQIVEHMDELKNIAAMADAQENEDPFGLPPLEEDIGAVESQMIN